MQPYGKTVSTPIRRTASHLYPRCIKRERLAVATVMVCAEVEKLPEIRLLSQPNRLQIYQSSIGKEQISVLSWQ